jgi:hypothetical protein
MIFRSPFNRAKVLRCNSYDNKDIIIENDLSQQKQFKDVELTSQLTQNSWNMSPYTRTNAYRDVVVSSPPPIGRIERSRNSLTKEKYHEHW